MVNVPPSPPPEEDQRESPEILYFALEEAYIEFEEYCENSLDPHLRLAQLAILINAISPPHPEQSEIEDFIGPIVARNISPWVNSGIDHVSSGRSALAVVESQLGGHVHIDRTRILAAMLPELLHQQAHAHMHALEEAFDAGLRAARDLQLRNMVSQGTQTYDAPVDPFEVIESIQILDANDEGYHADPADENPNGDADEENLNPDVWLGQQLEALDDLMEDSEK